MQPSFFFLSSVFCFLVTPSLHLERTLLLCSNSIMHLGNLLLVVSTAVLAVAAPSDKKKRAGNFQFFGVNQSGAEFGNGNLPGTLNKDYIWPPT